MDYEYMKTLLLVTVLSMFGGLIDAIMRFRAEGREMAWQTLFLKTFFDLLIAAFAGVLTFWMMEYVTGSRELNGLMCAAISMSGYLGGKAIDIVTTAWKAIIQAQSGGFK